MEKPELTQPRILIAFAIAIIADVIQFPLTLAEGTGLGLIPGEFVDFVTDCFVMGATTVLLGFHWVLLPSLFTELIPGLDLIPTWTGCVAFVVWQRKKEEDEEYQPSRFRPVVDVETIKPASKPPAQSPPPPSPAPKTIAPTIEQRLQRLERLRDAKVITPEECEAKRRIILDEI